VADLRGWGGGSSPSPLKFPKLYKWCRKKKETLKKTTLFSILRNIENNAFDSLLLLKGEPILQSKKL
jgi:hypothetical protein